MKSLHLLRHAKSSWKDSGLNDHDRPLNKRGRQTAKMMAAYLRRAKIAPDLVICSTAVRAQQTLDPILKAAKRPPKIVLVRGSMKERKNTMEQLWNFRRARICASDRSQSGLHDLALELADADSNTLLPSPAEISTVRWRVSISMAHGRLWSRTELARLIYNTKINCGITPRSQGARPVEMSVNPQVVEPRRTRRCHTIYLH